jgi:ABC-2 type transport system ATP-binding protein
MSAIKTESLRKEFGDTVAVDDINLDVEAGEVFGFLGPNGAGKSTTINMLLDFARPTAGSATVLGHDVQAESQQVRQRVGVLPEGFDLYDRLSGVKHIQFAGDAKGADVEPVDILERVGLSAEEGQRDVGGYSKGMQQRLALGMALVGDPELLIMDEPSSGLDPIGINEMQDIVRSEAESGTTVFFSSHILDHVEEICDRIGVMNEGKLVAEGSLEDLYDQMAGEATVELAVEETPDYMIDSVEDIDGVSHATARNGHVEIGCKKPRAKAKAIAHVEQNGSTVTDVQVEDQDIDDLFAELTTEDSQ